MSYLRVNQLTKRFGNVNAADDVSFSLDQGKVLCLLGPSGCGKTTTLRIVAGLTQQDSGEVILDGTDISLVPTHKRHVGMVFQSWALFPHLTVFDNVAFGLRISKTPAKEIEARVKSALEMVRLPDVGQRRPSQLSGGQQQRVALARTLVTNPKIMLFDEPLSNLDVKLRNEMRTELRRIQRALGLTALYVTHDQGEALSIGDTVAVMKDGKIVELGPPVELFERPRTAYVADFLGAENILHGSPSAQGDAFVCEGGMQVKMPDTVDDVKAIKAVGIRSENISLSLGGVEDAENQYRGVVREYDYQGSRVLYVVELAGSGARVKVSHGGTYRFGIDQEVVASWRADQTLPLI
jgi:ABC-type Fe3+/spermidine/putrescine transport system ATPase subunit